MKKILLSVLAVLALFGTSMAQNLPSYVPANGLVGWWPFNGNANDESGNNNNGTVNGPQLTENRFGNPNSAYLFSGSQTINIPSKAELNLSHNYAISLWYYPTEVLNPAVDIMIKGSTDFTGRPYYLRHHGPNNASQGFAFRHATGEFPAALSIEVNSSLPAQNNWHHIIISIRDSLTTLYVNGIPKDTVLFTGFQGIINNENLKIGGGYYQFNGKIDDIAFWNRPLTSQEINNLYQGGNTTANCLDMPSNLQQGLVGYWPFCGNALDESGNNNHGTVNGATLTTDRFGNAGSAYGFDGQISHIKVSDDSSFEGNSLAVSIWVKAQKYCRADKIRSDLIMKGIPSPFNYQWVTQLEQDGKIRVQSVTSSENIFDTQDSISKNEWHNIIRNWNGSILSVYVDGVLKGSINTSGSLVQGNGDLIFGGIANDQFFTGSLDDIAIWNRALSQSEISQLYNQGICQTSITVTDTLLIHTGITAYNPVAYGNTLKVWPNPGNQDITLDAGNLSSMQGWKYKVANTLGQTVVNETAISQQQTLIDLSTWGGNGIYYLHLINPQGHAIEIKKIVLAP